MTIPVHSRCSRKLGSRPLQRHRLDTSDSTEKDGDCRKGWSMASLLFRPMAWKSSRMLRKNQSGRGERGEEEETNKADERGSERGKAKKRREKSAWL